MKESQGFVYFSMVLSEGTSSFWVLTSIAPFFAFYVSCLFLNEIVGILQMFTSHDNNRNNISLYLSLTLEIQLSLTLKLVQDVRHLGPAGRSMLLPCWQ